MTLPRIFHLSDTHLGHQQYGRTDAASGLNQREADGYAAFRHVIDAALAKRPDCVIHAGDLFDGVRPSNRALAVALEGFVALSRAGIPVVVIAGNHEHPKMRETGSPFRLFEHLDGVHAAYKGRAESIEVAADLTVHAVPQCADNATLRAEVEGVRAGPGRNVLVLHGSVRDLPAFHHAEFNELTLDPGWFDDRFDYVALGHYHGTTEVAAKAWYCGAPERVSMAESGEEKGFLDVSLAGDAPEVTFRPVPGRPYADLPVIGAAGMDADGVVEACQDALARTPEGAVVRLRLEGLDPTLRGVIDRRAIRQAAAHALHLDLRTEWDDDEKRVAGTWQLGGLVDEFEAFAAGQALDGHDRDEILALARQVLAEASP